MIDRDLESGCIVNNGSRKRPDQPQVHTWLRSSGCVMVSVGSADEPVVSGGRSQALELRDGETSGQGYLEGLYENDESSRTSCWA